MRRKLIGINNFTDRDYEKVYVLEKDDGTIKTLREIYTSGTNYLIKSFITYENPYDLDFDFLEISMWEEL